MKLTKEQHMRMCILSTQLFHLAASIQECDAEKSAKLHIMSTELYNMFQDEKEKSK